MSLSRTAFLLALLLPFSLAAGFTHTAFAGEQAAQEAKPNEEEKKPAAGEEKPEAGDEKPEADEPEPKEEPMEDPAAGLPEWVVGESVSLFDGESLKGWVTQDGKPAPEGWIVEEGAICRADRGGNIFYAREVGDFELTFEWKTVEGGNNGLKYRVRKYGNQVLGCEYQMLGENKPSFSRGSAGSLYVLYEPNEKKQLKPSGEWNTAKIVAHGPVIEHWLNGEKIVEADLATEEWTKRLAESKFAPHKDFARNNVGRIMLTDHGSKAWFRNMVLTPLENREIPPLVVVEKPAKPEPAEEKPEPAPENPPAETEAPAKEEAPKKEEPAKQKEPAGTIEE